MIEHLTFQKGKGIGKGVMCSSFMGIVFYIVIKVFSFKKKIVNAVVWDILLLIVLI